MRRIRAWAWACAACLLGAPALSQADGADAYAIQLRPGPPVNQLGPRFRPMSSSVPLKATTKGPAGGMDHREGVLSVGPKGSGARRLVVSRSKAGEAYDLLLIDLDGDGSMDDETPIEARMQSSGKTIWSTFNIVLHVDHGKAGKPQVTQHPFRTYIAVQGKSAVPDVFNFTSQGSRVASLEIEGRAYEVVLTDRNNNARFGHGDVWTMRTTGGKGDKEAPGAHDVGAAINVGGRDWTLVLDGTGGRRAHVVQKGKKAGGAKPAGGGDGDENLPHAEDRALPRAATPLAFAESLDEARKKALKIQGPLFLSFETEESGDSTAMRELVYTARAVVDAAAGLSCARVDPDASRDLKTKYEVADVPTGILLDPQGNEVARFSGYQSVERLRDFLGAVHSSLRPGDDEPKLRGKNLARHKTQVKQRVAYLNDNSHQGLLVDRIKDLGTQKNRAARDALMQFAARRKSKEYITEAFFALAVIGGRTSVEFLCGPKALASKDFLVAQKAAQALALARDARSIEALLVVLEKRGTKIEVVSACCIALAQSAPTDERVVTAVFKYSKHQKDTIRSGAAEALGYLKSDAAVKRLRELLAKDKNTRVRGAAATGIGHTGRTELIPLLREAIKVDKAHTVRTAALEAIRELQGEKPATRR